MSRIQTKVFSARLKDRDALLKSSSGGVFTALSDAFLKDGNGVACSIYNYQTHQPEFRVITSIQERNEARGSKYTQSNPGNIFQECVSFLAEHPGKKLLFVGTGCQAAAFSRYSEMNKCRDSVTIVDLICHGVPAPELWKQYVQYIETQNHGSITEVNFKDKRNGWRHPTAYVKVNQQEVLLNSKLFYHPAAIRPSCTQCPYISVERNTNITIGDFWGIEKVMPDFYDEQGTSLILVNTEQGLKVFEVVKKDLDYRESNTTDCLQPNLIRPTSAASNRNQFWVDFKKASIPLMLKKYGKPTLKVRIKNKLKRILGR